MGDDRDRELDEILGELRVILPGVTVLFAFLLTLPFTAQFPRLATRDRLAFFVAFVSTALAIVMLVGETAYHRLRGKPYDKGTLVRTASRQSVAGIALLATALAAVVFLVTDIVYSLVVALVVTAAVAVAALLTWFALPLRRRAG